MDSIIKIKNMSFSYKDKKIFENFDLDIEKGKFIHIVGPNGSGKSTLVKILLGLLKAEGYVNVYRMNMCKDNLMDIRSHVGVVFENPDNTFVAETVADDIAFSLENLQYTSKTIEAKIKKISGYLGIEDLLEKNPHHLSGGEKELVSLAAALVNEPKILILDEAFTMIDGVEKEAILKLLRKLVREKKITVINVTHDMEDTTYGDKIIVLDNGKIVLNDDKEIIYQEEKKLKNLGLELPFMVDLSRKLQYYGLVDRDILSMNEMVNHLWK
ncbi:MAG: ATP-binding cassette domain-containing protein [Firmicutes bacterium]|nr:ATP-binding cassette domain-containing protein [Bacillota bacterium]